MKTILPIGYKITGFFAVLFMVQSAKSQSIFYLYDDYKYALLFINKSTNVSIRTKLMHDSYKGPEGIFEFYFLGDTIKQRFGNELSALTDTKDYHVYEHTPYYISIRNNNFKISSDPEDSLLYDSKGRVIEVYSFYLNKRKYIKQFYLGDTCIVSTDNIGLKPTVILYFLDQKCNLQYQKIGNADSAMLASGVIDLTRVDFEKGIRFNYDRLKKHIDIIQQFDIVEGKELRTYTQWFVYKNGRPVKSFERNEETGNIEYQQIYTYSPIASNRTIKGITK